MHQDIMLIIMNSIAWFAQPTVQNAPIQPIALNVKRDILLTQPLINANRGVLLNTLHIGQLLINNA